MSIKFESPPSATSFDKWTSDAGSLLSSFADCPAQVGLNAYLTGGYRGGVQCVATSGAPAKHSKKPDKCRTRWSPAWKGPVLTAVAPPISSTPQAAVRLGQRSMS